MSQDPMKLSTLAWASVKERDSSLKTEKHSPHVRPACHFLYSTLNMGLGLSHAT